MAAHPPTAEGTYMTGSGESPRRRRMRKNDAWLLDRYDASKEELKQWEDAALPPHFQIIAGFLATNHYVFGIPDKTEIFRLDTLTKESGKRVAGSKASHTHDLQLHYVQPSPDSAVRYTMATQPRVDAKKGSAEVDYNVRLSAIVLPMNLVNIRVVHGSPTNDDVGIVFEGAELLGPARQRRVRVVRITILNDEIGTWETVTELSY